jgi:hypothetical protein
MSKLQFKQDLKDNGVVIDSDQIDNLLHLFEEKYEVRAVLECKAEGTILSRLFMPFLWVFIGFIVCPIHYIFKGRYQLGKKSIWLKLWNKVS